MRTKNATTTTVTTTSITTTLPVTNTTMTDIGDGAISGKSQIKSVNLNAVLKIGAEAFANCSNLANFSQATAVNAVGKDAFINTAWYKKQINSSTKFIKVGQVLYKYNSTSTSCNLATDSTIMYVSDNAFDGSVIRTIDFGNVNQLTGADYDMPNLTSVKKYGTAVTVNDAFLYNNIEALAGTPYVKSMVDAKVKKIITDCGLTYGASASSTTLAYKLDAIKKLRQYTVNNWTYEFTKGNNSQVVHGQGHAWNLVE